MLGTRMSVLADRLGFGFELGVRVWVRGLRLGVRVWVRV